MHEERFAAERTDVIRPDLGRDPEEAEAAGEQVVLTHLRFDPPALATFVSGFVLTVFGLLSLVRAGMTGFPSHQVTVAGITLSSFVALLTIFVGVGLLLSGASGYAGGAGSMFFSAMMLAAGIVVVADSQDLPRFLYADAVFGFLLGLFGAAILLTTAVIPTHVATRWLARRAVPGTVVVPTVIEPVETVEEVAVHEVPAAGHDHFTP
jgi:hypothetical protein